MAPVKRKSRKQDQPQRQDRRRSGRLTSKRESEKERRSSNGRPGKSIQQKNHRPSYNLRSNRQKHRRSDHLSDNDHTKLHEVTHTTENLRRDSHPEEFPDLNFHHSFGSFLTRKNPILESVDADIGKYWALLNKSPTMLQYHIHDIGDRYREAFRRFFTAEPISLHGHVSDASSPALLTSLISHLTSGSSKGDSNAFLDEGDKANPRIAILEGSYGAGYGPLAHNSVLEFVRPLANGSTPVVIETHDAAKIDEQVRNAKLAGCMALIAEIVRARDGVAISQAAWKNLLRACKTHNIVLVVDEALTAMRCGAPFAYQLPQYQKHGFPDLVLFGKAVKTNGVAVDWRGINMQKLGITDPEERLFMALQWQERLTEMAPAASLLTSWGTIVLAERENWPRRSRVIGDLLRGFVQEEGIKSTLIGGLHGLLYLRVQDQARISSPVMGANAGKYVRWFPMIDEVMMSKDELKTKVFGPGSIPHRKDVSAYLNSKGVRLGFCARCGQAVEAGLKPTCEVCVVGICEDCEPDDHVCPMRDVGR